VIQWKEETETNRHKNPLCFTPVNHVKILFIFSAKLFFKRHLMALSEYQSEAWNQCSQKLKTFKGGGEREGVREQKEIRGS